MWECSGHPQISSARNGGAQPVWTKSIFPYILEQTGYCPKIETYGATAGELKVITYHTGSRRTDYIVLVFYPQQLAGLSRLAIGNLSTAAERPSSRCPKHMPGTYFDTSKNRQNRKTHPSTKLFCCCVYCLASPSQATTPQEIAT